MQFGLLPQHLGIQSSLWLLYQFIWLKHQNHFRFSSCRSYRHPSATGTANKIETCQTMWWSTKLFPPPPPNFFCCCWQVWFYQCYGCDCDISELSRRGYVVVAAFIPSTSFWQTSLSEFGHFSHGKIWLPFQEKSAKTFLLPNLTECSTPTFQHKLFPHKLPTQPPCGTVLTGGIL